MHSSSLPPPSLFLSHSLSLSLSLFLSPSLSFSLSPSIYLFSSLSLSLSLTLFFFLSHSLSSLRCAKCSIESGCIGHPAASLTLIYSRDIRVRFSASFASCPAENLCQESPYNRSRCFFCPWNEYLGWENKVNTVQTIEANLNFPFLFLTIALLLLPLVVLFFHAFAWSLPWSWPQSPRGPVKTLSLRFFFFFYQGSHMHLPKVPINFFSHLFY